MADAKHFSCGDDVLLLRAARAAAPWQAARVMDAWDALAQRLGAFPTFPRDKDARAIRTRFHLLLKKHRADKLGSMRTTGDSDELVERERLLRDVDAKLRAYDLSKRGVRHPNADEDDDEEDTSVGDDSDARDHHRGTNGSKKRRRSASSDDAAYVRLAATNDRALALLERVLDQQQQQLNLQRDQIEKQLAMQQQQMQVLVELVERVSRP